MEVVFALHWVMCTNYNEVKEISEKNQVGLSDIISRNPQCL